MLNSDYFNFAWGDDGISKAHGVKMGFAKGDPSLNIGVNGILLAAVVTSRGRKRSPSSALETLINSKRRTNLFIIDSLKEAWNVLTDQGADTSDRWDVLVSLINPKNRNKSGCSEALRYQFTMTYEAFIDYWITLSDMMTGFRSVSSKIFGVGETVGIGEYLVNGMTRAQLLQAFGHQFNVED